MNQAPIDHNALLLQVMAHDLLAPLTAIKWQTELLGREGGQGVTPKYMERLQGVYDSTQLGITLTKHAHVAGRVLVGSYVQDLVNVSLSSVIQASAMDLRFQYERHGLKLEVDVDDDQSTRDLDVELVGLFVWSIAKFFLSSAPANTTVSIRGLSAPRDGEGSTYVLIASAPGIPEAEKCVQTLSSLEATGSYDQSYVFAKLIHATAPLLGVTVSASVQGSQLMIEAPFD
jgi:K+-sensing histidine kinase KdpD